MNIVTRAIHKMDNWLAATLPTVPFPKAPKGIQAYPGYRTNVVAATSALRRTDAQLASTDRLVAARTLSDTRRVLRALVKSSPDLAAAVSFLLRTGIPEGFSVVSRDMDGRLNPAATELAHELLRRMLFLGNADGSYATQLSLQSLSEQLAKELILDGAMCLEVALDKARVPASMNPISIPTLEFYEEDNGVRMTQKIGGTEIDLDIPTIVYVAVDQLQTEAYPASYIESAIQPILQDLDFNNDTRRVLKRSVMPRLQAIISSELVKKMTPPEVLANAEAFSAYKNAIVSAIEQSVNGLNPEDALVHYDSVDFKIMEEGSNDPSAIIERIQKVINGKLAAGAKTLPIILGHGQSSNASSTEAMLYVKQANMLRVKLNEVYSKALTIAIRIMGQDCYVEFKYDSIDLRPDSELESFRSMRQSRVLTLLSLGLIPDDEASVMLTGNLPPAGMKPLSGTMFKVAPSGGEGNPTSNTSATEQTLSGDAPKGAKGQNSSSKK